MTAAREKVADGWQFVRFDIPSEGERFEPRAAVRRGVEQFAALREAVGDDVEIIIDVHTRLDLADAVTLCRELEPLSAVLRGGPGALRKLGVRWRGCGRRPACRWRWASSMRRSGSFASRWRTTGSTLPGSMCALWAGSPRR